MEEIIQKREVPEMPSEIRIQHANQKFSTSERTEISDLSQAGIADLVEKVRDGTYRSLFLCPDECGEEGYLLLESSADLIFLQVNDEMARTAWACFDPEYLDSGEEAPIPPSDGQSVFPMKCTMRDRELAAACVEWYCHTCGPYPGMDWLKMSWQ